MKVSHSVVSEYMNYARLPGKDTSSPNCQKGCVLSRCLFFVGKCYYLLSMVTICRNCIRVGYNFVGLVYFSGKRVFHLFFVFVIGIGACCSTPFGRKRRK